jgi:hypothetical protein
MKKDKKIKSEIPEKHFDSKDGTFCVYEIYHRQKKTIYYLQGSQSKYISKIVLEGFEGIPPGLYLYKNGYGFQKKGTFLLSALKNNLAITKQLEFTITNKKIKLIRNGVFKTSVVLPHLDVKNLLIRLGRINEDSNNDLRGEVASFLSTKFPRQIKISTENFDDYRGGEVAALLRRKKVAQKLNEEDMESLKTFFPKIFETSLKGKKSIKIERSALIRDTKKVTDKIFLDEVIKEFGINLAKKTLSETEWQKFLSEKVFRFLANYITTIEKQNVSISVSYPDFVVADIYGFVDVFEIKRHETPLLALDDSHDNYYWKPDIVKAISQIENYVDEIIRNSDDYIRVVKKKKGVDIRVVRPRGYIIAGMSSQFKNKKESGDFRKLGCALKNISFILYDELLENLKNLRSKL